MLGHRVRGGPPSRGIPARLLIVQLSWSRERQVNRKRDSLPIRIDSGDSGVLHASCSVMLRGGRVEERWNQAAAQLAHGYVWCGR